MTKTHNLDCLIIEILEDAYHLSTDKSCIVIVAEPRKKGQAYICHSWTNSFNAITPATLFRRL